MSNYYNTNKVLYLIIHYTADNGASAENVVNYFKNVSTKTSAHYVVDELGYIQAFDEKYGCMHSGSYYTNTHSIGIEMCCKTTGDELKADKNWYFEEKTVQNSINLVKSLVKKYCLTRDKVKRHYDVNGKYCPAPFVFYSAEWDKFLDKVFKEEEMEVYRTIEEVPQDYKIPISWAMANGILNGTGEVAENGHKVINVSEHDCRALTFDYRCFRVGMEG